MTKVQVQDFVICPAQVDKNNKQRFWVATVIAILEKEDKERNLTIQWLESVEKFGQYHLSFHQKNKPWVVEKPAAEFQLRFRKLDDDNRIPNAIETVLKNQTEVLDPVSERQTKQQKKNDTDAFENLLQSEEDADTQFNLGIMYEAGRGVAKDDKQACIWFERRRTKGMQMRKHNSKHFNAALAGAEKVRRGFIRSKPIETLQDVELRPAHFFFDIVADGLGELDVPGRNVDPHIKFLRNFIFQPRGGRLSTIN